MLLGCAILIAYLSLGIVATEVRKAYITDVQQMRELDITLELFLDLMY